MRKPIVKKRYVLVAVEVEDDAPETGLAMMTKVAAALPRDVKAWMATSSSLPKALA